MKIMNLCNSFKGGRIAPNMTGRVMDRYLKASLVDKFGNTHVNMLRLEIVAIKHG